MTSTPRDLEALLAHDGFVRSVARGLLLDDARVDDVVQQTWIAAWEDAPGEPRSIRAWLASVARNFARDSRRRDAARALRERAAARPEGVPSMAKILEREAMRRAVVEAVAELEEPYQSAILLRYFESLPPREMAKRLGVPPETARTRVKRGIERLRAKLEGRRLLDGEGWSATLFQLASLPPAAGAGAAAATSTAMAPIAAALASVKVWAALAASAAIALLVWFVATAGPPSSPAPPSVSPGPIARADAPVIPKPPDPASATPEPKAPSSNAPAVAAAPEAAKRKVEAPVSPTRDDATLVVDAATATTIRGRARFEGVAPERKPIDVLADAACHAAHKDDPLLSEDAIVNANGTLRNVFVRVARGLEGRRFDPPELPVVFDQVGCRYVPHVVGIQVGQTWRIRNSDPTLHNVHSMPKKNTQFNQAMPARANDVVSRFKNPELSISVKCDVHPWMSAVVHVVEHPYFAVTGDTGEFTIGKLPPGRYTLEGIHEKYGAAAPVVVDVAARETKEIEFVFRAK